MSSRARSRGESIALFNKYLISTSLRIPNIHKVALVPNAENNQQNVEEQLVLYNRRITQEDVAVLRDYILESHRFLTKLHLNNNRTGPEGAKILASLLERDATNLQELFLNRNYLYDEGNFVSALSRTKLKIMFRTVFPWRP